MWRSVCLFIVYNALWKCSEDNQNIFDCLYKLEDNIYIVIIKYFNRVVQVNSIFVTYYVDFSNTNNIIRHILNIPFS